MPHCLRPPPARVLEVPAYPPVLTQKDRGPRREGEQLAYAGLVLKDPVTNESGRFTTRATRFSARMAILFLMK